MRRRAPVGGVSSRDRVALGPAIMATAEPIAATAAAAVLETGMKLS